MQGAAMGGVPYVLERYMVAFHYGSLVLLNFDAREQDAVLNDAQPFCDVHFRGAHKDGEGGHVHRVVPFRSLAGRASNMNSRGAVQGSAED